MKSRLVWAIAAVAAIALVLFGIPLAVILQRSYQDEELLRLQRDTIAASRSIDTATTVNDRPELPAFTGQLAVYQLPLRRLVGNGPPHGDAIVRRALTTRTPSQSAANGRLVVAIPLFRGERIVGVARGARSQAAVAERTHRAWLLLAAGAAALAALAILAARGLGRRLARPLETLADDAQRIGAGDFATRAGHSAVPEIDALARALNASSQRIAELVAREREFTANASHQLRTPLAALRLELEAGLLDHPADTTLANALREADRLQTTITTLLAHAQGQDQQTGSDPCAALDETLARLRERWHGPLAAAGRPLRIAGPSPKPSATIPPAILDEILDILLDNALHHGAGTVTVTVRPTADAIAIDVEDQGAGFGDDPERAFARGVGSRTGIGLPLAHSLAHAQNALLTVSRSGPRPIITLLVAAAGDPTSSEESMRINAETVQRSPGSHSAPRIS